MDQLEQTEDGHFTQKGRGGGRGRGRSVDKGVDVWKRGKDVEARNGVEAGRLTEARLEGLDTAAAQGTACILLVVSDGGSARAGVNRGGGQEGMEGRRGGGEEGRSGES